MLHLDTGIYALFESIRVSAAGTPEFGSDEGFTITGPMMNLTREAQLVPVLPENRPSAILELNNADGMNLRHLTLAGAERGLWVHGGSDNLRLFDITSHDHTGDGMFIETSSPGSRFERLDAHENGGSGVVVIGTIGGITRIWPAVFS